MRSSIRCGAGALGLAALLCGPWSLAAQESPGTSGDGAAIVEPNDADLARIDAEVAAQAARNPSRGPVTNMPLPRYVSLKGSEGNARRGPSLSHRIDWVFRHAGMPLRVTAEYGHWRRVEDRDGAGGWIHYSLLSGVRSAIVEEDMAELLLRPEEGAAPVALAEAGSVVRLGRCLPDWCEVAAAGEEGWLPKTAVWGVDPDELRE